MSDPIEDAQKPVEEVKPAPSFTKEEITALNEGCKQTLIEVLDFLDIKYGLITTDVSQSGSGEKLVLTCKWAYEFMPDGKMFKGNFFFQRGDAPRDARQILAMQITLGINPLGQGYYIMADTMSRFHSEKEGRNAPPEVFVRAVISDMKKTGKIAWMQAPQALAQILHIEENINDIYGVDTGEIMKQAAAAKKIQIAKK